MDGRVSLYTSGLDSEFQLYDWLFIEKNCILLLMVSTFANTVIVYEYISAQKQLLWFCLSHSVIEETNKGKSWICMPLYFLTWLNWIVARFFLFFAPKSFPIMCGTVTMCIVKDFMWMQQSNRESVKLTQSVFLWYNIMILRPTIHVIMLKCPGIIIKSIVQTKTYTLEFHNTEQ